MEVLHVEKMNEYVNVGEDVIIYEPCTIFIDISGQ